MQVLQLILKWCMTLQTPFQNEHCKFRKNEEKKTRRMENRKKCLYKEWFKRTKKIFEKVDKLMCHDKRIRAIGTNRVSLECLHTQSDNQNARGHPFRDEKVANLGLLKGSFWFLVVICFFFFLKKEKYCGLWNLLTWKGFGVKDLMRYKAAVSKNHPVSPITAYI